MTSSLEGATTGVQGTPVAPPGKHLTSPAQDLLLRDLEKSGIAAEDIGAYLAEEPEIAAIGLRPHMVLGAPGGSVGYVIPYYKATGLRAAFYRVKLFNPLPKGAKYLQPAGTPTHIYYPKGFVEVLDATRKGQSLSCVNGFRPAMMIVEGEKKAAKAVKEGFLCVGLGGVYNWRTRTLTLPEDCKIVKNEDTGTISIKLPEDGDVQSVLSGNTGVLAGGMQELIALIRNMNLQVIVAFDTDESPNPLVQQAAASLAFELRSHGIPTMNIRQLQLPAPQGHKMGVDDYLVQKGPKLLQDLLHDVLSKRCAFPRHPNIKQYTNQILQAQALRRSKAKELAMSILADLDVRGMRMKEMGSDDPYFFDSETKKLMRVNLLHHHQEPMHESNFGQFLYQTYDISQADIKMVPWIAAGFTGEAPVYNVSPRSTICLLPDNKLAFQLNDGQFAVLSGDENQPLRIADNGTEDVLFRSDQVEPVDLNALTEAFKLQLKWLRGSFKFTDLWWYQALSGFKFLRPTDVTLATLLFYISPWLWRWKGTQLPVELMIGEPGSGKSSMYALRLAILNGRPYLRNQPTDIRDWYSSITSQDGLHVTDNIHFASKEIRQRLSDEICRLVTEPSPFVEMRRLFSTAENMRLPVRTVFAMTAIQQPFVNADILQRSIIFELGAVGKDHSSDWPGDQLRVHGGREAWIAHHLAVLHVFFRAATKEWNPNYTSGHRLANFEQSLALMGKVLNCEQAATISKHMSNTAEEQVSEYDWTMEALKEFTAEILPQLQKNPKMSFTAQDIAAWAMAHEDFSDNQIVTNSRRVARYIKSHAYMVSTVTGIFETGKKANRMTYRTQPVKRL